MKTVLSDLGFTTDGCFIIAEVGQAHDGSLGTAHAFIDAVADCGADAVKFQTHIAAAESTRDEPWRVKFSPQDHSRYEYWKRMEFTVDQWQDLADHARARDLEFLSSPFSTEAVAMLEHIGVRVWKIASGEIYNPQLLKAVWSTRNPILFSSGMSTLDDLAAVVDPTREKNIPFGILQCSSSYPSEPESWGLGAMSELRERFECPIGYSDHSGTIYSGIAAAVLGAQLIELHVTFSKKMFGPDVTSSVTLEDLSRLVEGVKMIGRALKTSRSKDALASDTLHLKTIFGRSLALKVDRPAGSAITESDLVLKKPGGGIPYDQKSRLIGRRLRAAKSADQLLRLDDLE